MASVDDEPFEGVDTQAAASTDEQHTARNELTAYTVHNLVQAGSISGGLHIHNPAAPSSLNALADRLAVEVHRQWAVSAAERGLLEQDPLPIRWSRSTEPVAGPVMAATSARGGDRFETLPGIRRVTPAQLRQGTRRTLHHVYGGLASGRLILTGGPGAGKSSAAVLLLLDALRFRHNAAPDQRFRVPVPVLFTLHGWNPDTTPLLDWVAATLIMQVPLLAHRRHRAQIATLLSTDRVAVFLDGLDEIPEHRLPTVLRALSQQAIFRLVLLTRTAELAKVAHRYPLTGAVALELQPLSPDDAATYLEHRLLDPPPQPWGELLTTLTADPQSPIARALSSPLAVTLLRDIYLVYQPSPNVTSPVGTVDELLDVVRFPAPESIVHHLLDHVIVTTYAPVPGQRYPRYSSRTARRTLALIARYLGDSNTRDLAWWTISEWVPSVRLALISGLLVATFGGMLSALAGLLVFDSSAGFALAGVTGIVVGFACGLVPVLAGPVSHLPLPAPRPRELWRGDRTSKVAFGLALGLVFGAVAGVVVGLVFGGVTGLVTGLALGLVSAPVFALASPLLLGLEPRPPGSSLPVTGPRDLWRADFITKLLFGLVVGQVFGHTSGLALSLLVGHLFEFTINSVFGLVFGFVAGLMSIVLSYTWLTMVSQVYLCVRYRTPLRLMRFLDDAHVRQLLRTIGPIYQFRHATFQDRLAPHSEAAIESVT